jgi:T5SS/PEP-CTERM-associated repeat protein
MMKRTQLRSLVLTAGALAVVGGAAFGASFNVLSGDWNVDGNWNPSGVPSAATTVYVGDSTKPGAVALIPNGYAATCGTLHVGYGRIGSIVTTGGRLSPVTPTLGGTAGGWGRLVFTNAAFIGNASANFVLGAASGSTGEIFAVNSAFTNLAAVLAGNASGAWALIRLENGSLLDNTTASQKNCAIGAAAGSVGRMEVLSGSRVWVYGLRVGDAGSGSLRVENATVETLSPGAAVIDNAAGAYGSVELVGTQRVFRAYQLTVGDNGYLTNRITKLAGGLEITRPDAHANQLVVTAPGRIHLSFESDPVATGPYWGLRIPGDRVTYLAALTNAPARLTWSDAGLHAMYKDKVKIFKDATYTYVGVDVTALPPAPPVLGTIGYTR